MPSTADEDLVLSPVRVYPDKTSIYHQGDEVVRLYRVKSGVVMTYRLLENDDRQITGFCTEGDFFGLSSDETFHDNAITVTSCGLQSIEISYIASRTDLQRQILFHSCKNTEDTQNLMALLTRKSSEARVAAFLLMLAERKSKLDKMKYGEGAGKVSITMPMSRSDIADYLSLSRETVSRRLTDFQNEGLIDLADIHTAIIPEISALRQRAA